MIQSALHPLLYVGLGNPGLQYEMTRHNVGYKVVKAFAKQMDWSLKIDRRFNAFVAKGEYQNRIVYLLLPLTFMNLSGESVKRLMDYFKLPLESVLVISDDIALPFGQLRLKPSGGAGGHNGLKNIEKMIGSNQYMRLRMGIGHPGQWDLADYVLSPFTAIEQEKLPVFIDDGVNVLKCLMQEERSVVMNSVNTILSATQKQKLPEKIIDLTKPPL